MSGVNMRIMALRVLIGSIAVSALMGIWVLIWGTGGDLETKVLVTALSTSALSLLVMVNGAALERRRLGPLPYAGMVASTGAFLLLMGIIWERTGGPVWARATLCLAAVGAGAAVACLLSLATLARAFAWVRLTGLATDLALVCLLNLFIWDLVDPENQVAVRLLGVLAVVMGAVTLATPVLHRMSSRTGRDAGSYCVSCGAALAGGLDSDLSCDTCGRHFRVVLVGDGEGHF